MKEFRKKFSAVLVMFLLIFMLLYTLFREKGEISFQENRSLAQFPKFNISEILNGKYSLDIIDFFSDQIAGRSKFMKIYSDISAGNIESKVNGVFVSDNMLLNGNINTSDISDTVAEKINGFAEKYNSSFYFIAVPSSDGIYSNLLPEYIPPDFQSEQIQNFYNKLNPEIRKINAFNILKNFSDDYIYYRTDTKWTAYGAYCVYRTAIQKLGFIPVAYDKFTIEHITSEFKGNLYNRTLYEMPKNDFIDLYYSDSINIQSITAYNQNLSESLRVLYDKSFLNSKYMYDIYLGENVPALKIKTGVNNNKKLMVIKDSYADCFIPFLTQHYSEITVISVDFPDFRFTDYFNINGYEQIIFVCGVENLLKPDIMNILAH
ncbi:MAG: DHHW family protein [Ruminococcus sp.]|nr:DHHW family protein [Oscillospiraceae bacterium]MDY4413386.1 DHHW family protein [Ruminococcus sp.]